VAIFVEIFVWVFGLCLAMIHRCGISLGSRLPAGDLIASIHLSYATAVGIIQHVTSTRLRLTIVSLLINAGHHGECCSIVDGDRPFFIAAHSCTTVAGWAYYRILWFIRLLSLLAAVTVTVTTRAKAIADCVAVVSGHYLWYICIWRCNLKNPERRNL
jgi:hypothetical protein